MKNNIFCVFSLTVGILSFFPQQDKESSKLTVINVFGDGTNIEGTKEEIKTFASLKSDPKGNLPAIFTICSMVMTPEITTVQTFLVLLGQNDESSFTSFEIHNVEPLKTMVYANFVAF